MSTAFGVFCISLLALPITYSVNLAQSLEGEGALLISGVIALTFLCVLLYIIAGKSQKQIDKLYYVLAITTFACVVDLTISLENDGYLRGFMTNYLRNGEPYLKGAYGTMICYWDGICHYAMNLVMLKCLATNQSYRKIGLYWAASIGHSMVVFMPGNVAGKYGVRWSFLLNVPYCIIPYWCAGRFLMERPVETQSKEEAKKYHTSILSRPVDTVMACGLLASLVIAVFRAFAIFGTKNIYMAAYLKHYEPYLLDDNTYPKFQMMIYLFYFGPFYIMALYGLLYPGCSYMPDWSLIHAGAAANAQFAHIGGAYHWRTPAALRVSSDPTVQMVFWIINGGLFLFPQLFALRCNVSQKLFIKTKTVTIEEKKIN